MEGYYDGFSAGAGFFDQSLGDSLGELALLVGGAAFEQGYLNQRHKKPVSVACCQRNSTLRTLLRP